MFNRQNQWKSVRVHNGSVVYCGEPRPAVPCGWVVGWQNAETVCFKTVRPR